MSVSSRVLCSLVLAGCGLLPLAAVAHGPAEHPAGLGVAAAFDSTGRLWVVTAHDGHVWLRTDGKPAHWQRATDSDWKVAACPEQGPALAIGADGVRHAVWYESSHAPTMGYGQLDPGHPPRHQLRLGASGDGGEHFAPARAIATAPGAVYSPELQREYPSQVQLVTVATDSIARHDATLSRLRSMQAARYPARAYADPTPQRLNYLIDANWGGEIPRTRVVRADGERAAASGDLNAEQSSKLRPPSSKTSPAVHLDDAWVRLLPAPLPAGGYFTLHNDGDVAVLLTGASSPVWGMVMLHRSRMSEGQSGMTMVDQVRIPPHGSVRFAPGGYHLMLMDATQPLKAGQHVDITLHFKGGAILQVPFLLRPADATGS